MILKYYYVFDLLVLIGTIHHGWMDMRELAY